MSKAERVREVQRKDRARAEAVRRLEAQGTFGASTQRVDELAREILAATARTKRPNRVTPHNL